MWISLPKMLCGIKRRKCTPSVSRSKSWTDKCSVKIRESWRGENTISESRTLPRGIFSPPPISSPQENRTLPAVLSSSPGKKFSSSPDLTSSVTSPSTLPRTAPSTQYIECKQYTQSKQYDQVELTKSCWKTNNFQENNNHEIPTSPSTSSTTTGSTTTPTVSCDTSPHRPSYRPHLPQIKRSSLTLILPDQVKSAPPEKPARTRIEGTRQEGTRQQGTRIEGTRSKQSSVSCVQLDCVVCTLARPEIRHCGVILHPGFWREFY